MSIWYRMLLSACQRGTTTQLALDGALKVNRITEAEHTELSGILDAVLNPPPAPEPEPTPEPTPEPEAPATSNDPSTVDEPSDEPADT